MNVLLLLVAVITLALMLLMVTPVAAHQDSLATIVKQVGHTKPLILQCNSPEILSHFN